MDPRQETSGDYGYDLVHEAAGQAQRSVRPDGSEERTQPVADRGTIPDGDFGYDEAHDFRTR